MLALTSEHARFGFETSPWRMCRPPIRLLEREFGELRSGDSDGGSLVGDLGLQPGALSTAAESAEAAEPFLGGGQALLGCLERLLALASAALQDASRDLAWVWPGLCECQLLGGRSLQRASQASDWIGRRQEAPVPLAFERLTG